MNRSTPDPAACYTMALGMLARRELTTFQLRQRLRARGFSDAAIAEAVARLTDAGSLDDRRAALAHARNELTIKRHGPLRAVQALEAAGVRRDLARDAVDEVFGDADQSSLIAEAIARRVRRSGPLEPAELRRLRGWLLRQGFSPEAVARVLKRGVGSAWADEE